MQRQEVMQKIESHLNSIITQSFLRYTTSARKQADKHRTGYNSSDGSIYSQSLSLMINHFGQMHIFLHRKILTTVPFCAIGDSGMARSQGIEALT